MRWHTPKGRRSTKDWELAQGRLEPRCIKVLDHTDATRFDFQDVRQVFRIRRRSACKHPPRASGETVDGITSVSSTRADAQQLLAWNRGHWTVAANHDARDRDDQRGDLSNLISGKFTA